MKKIAGTKNVDAYIKDFPKETQDVLKKIRNAIQSIAPSAIESISYRIPAYKLNGKVLLYFAGFPNHASMYPTSAKLFTIMPELTPYRSGQGTLKFPLDKSLPITAVKKFIKYRVKEVEKLSGKK